ncbi:MAG TPA: cation-translocating P-type ATPase [Proteobacteria bacterium]|nr:cation-translocating P-type ATPase [Pseudomonadota bacterium]
MKVAPYQKTATELFAELVCDGQGLSETEATARLEKYGFNRLREMPPPHPLRIFLEQFKSFIIYILLFAVAFALAIGEYVDSLIIVAIVLVNAFIGFFQEFGAARSLAALKEMTEVEATVLRDGNWRKLKSRDLVPGDLVSLVGGDRIPADARVLEANRLLVDEAVLTGESLPVTKTTEVHTQVLELGDRKNMLFASTAVVSGRGLGLVVATGMETEIGAIAGLVESAVEEVTPLQRRLDRFGHRLGLVIIFICLMVMVLSCGKEYLQFHNVSRESLIAFSFIAISLAVAAVPTALPAVVTIALSIGVKRLLRRKALVRRLAAVETLGSCDIICSDKTGTLTCNQMTVVRAWTLNREIALDGESLSGALEEVEKLLFTGGALCNDAEIKAGASGREKRGDPTEIALLISAEQAHCRISAARVDEIPFDGQRKMMSVTVIENGAFRLYAKGAPDSILKVCAQVLLDGEVLPLDENLRRLIAGRNDFYAGQAMRVLGFAVSPLLQAETSLPAREEGLIFIGLQAMLDPPRADVRAAIVKTYAAGIRVIMITGDYRETARAVGKEVGIEGGILTGAELAGMSDAELRERLAGDTNIFARMVPEHKQRIVTLLQELGHIVAMTGDGVNDAPALKKADIGIAVGSGTDVAKEAADFVLLDDSFTHIVNAIEEGRGIYDNIQKSIMLLLSGNLGEVLIIFLAVLLGWNLPLTAVMLLWINMVTDGAPALAFSVDGYGRNIMRRPPKKKDEPLLTGAKLGLIAFMGVTGTLLGLFLFYHFGGVASSEDQLSKARTVVFNFVVLYEMILVFLIRKEYEVPFFSNLWVWNSIIFSLLLQGVLMYTSSLAFYFRITPLSFFDLAWIVSLGLLFSLVFLVYRFSRSLSLKKPSL